MRGIPCTPPSGGSGRTAPCTGLSPSAVRARVMSSRPLYRSVFTFPMATGSLRHGMIVPSERRVRPETPAAHPAKAISPASPVRRPSMRQWGLLSRPRSGRSEPAPSRMRPGPAAGEHLAHERLSPPVRDEPRKTDPPDTQAEPQGEDIVQIGDVQRERVVFRLTGTCPATSFSAPLHAFRKAPFPRTASCTASGPSMLIWTPSTSPDSLRGPFPVDERAVREEVDLETLPLEHPEDVKDIGQQEGLSSRDIEAGRK